MTTNSTQRANRSVIRSNILKLNVAMALLVLRFIPVTAPSHPEMLAATPEPSASSSLSPTASQPAWSTGMTAAAMTGAPSRAQRTPQPTASNEAAGDLPDPNLAGPFASAQLIVRFRGGTSRTTIEQCVLSAGASIHSEIEQLNALILSTVGSSLSSSMHSLQTCAEFRYAEPNYLVQALEVIPTDPGWAAQYGLGHIRAVQGWELSTGSTAVTIAVLDTGIDQTHPDLADKIVPGYDFVNDDSAAQDDNGHGTHVAGIAAASSNNGTGIAGVSWGARLMPVKVLNSSGSGTYAAVAQGILWAVDHGAQIINLSLGGTNESQLLQDAIDYAEARGVLLVAASGNDGSNQVLYPARFSNVIAVGATDPTYTRPWFSNYGPEIDLAAPGASIYSTDPGGYSYRDGTSMATAFVAGLAAILRGIPGNDSPALIRQQMESSALDLGPAGPDDFYGYGLIQMDAALSLVLEPATATSTPVIPPMDAAGHLTAAFPGMLPSPTLTITPTVTDIPDGIQSQVASMTTPQAATDIERITDYPANTPEVIALESPPSGGPNGVTDLFLPGCGVALILAGLALFLSARRQRKRRRSAIL